MVSPPAKSIAAGQTASVFDCGPGCTYSWVIEGGSIQGSAANASISFTPNAANVTLTVTIADERACQITTINHLFANGPAPLW